MLSARAGELESDFAFGVVRQLFEAPLAAASADARADLLQDVREWHLVPEWHWGVGRPSQLAGVWGRYQVGVSVVTKRIAGTAIHYITHTEAAYVVDSSGHERALFIWPFYPQDVERELRQIT